MAFIQHATRHPRWRLLAVFTGLVAALVAGLVACATSVPAQSQVPVDNRIAVQQISEISIESNCFGCSTGSLLNLHRDGRAVLTITGHARHGTTDQRSSGRIAPAEFDALARALLEQGFFALADSYDDPAVQDGGWATIRAVRDGQTKQVFRRGAAAPPELRRVEAALAGLQGRIRFNP